MLDDRSVAIDDRTTTPQRLSSYFRLLFWAALVIILDFNITSSSSQSYGDGLVVNQGITTGFLFPFLPDFIGIALCICVIHGLRRFSLQGTTPQGYRPLLIIAEVGAWGWLFTSAASIIVHTPDSWLWEQITSFVSLATVIGTTCFFIALVQLCNALELKSKKWWLLCVLCEAIMGLQTSLAYLPNLPESKSTSFTLGFLSLSAVGPFIFLAVAALCALLAGLVFFLIAVIQTRRELNAKYERDPMGGRVISTAIPVLLLAGFVAVGGIIARPVINEAVPPTLHFKGRSSTSGSSSNVTGGGGQRYELRLYNTKSSEGGILALYYRRPLATSANGGFSFSSNSMGGMPGFTGSFKADARTGIIKTPQGQTTLDSPFVLFYADPYHSNPIRIDIPLEKQKEFASIARSEGGEWDALADALDAYLPKFPGSESDDEESDDN